MTNDPFTGSTSRRKPARKGGSAVIIGAVAAVAIIGCLFGAYVMLNGGKAGEAAGSGSAAAVAVGDPYSRAVAAEEQRFAAEMAPLGMTGDMDIAKLAREIDTASARAGKAQVLIGSYRSRMRQHLAQARRDASAEALTPEARTAALAAFDAKHKEAQALSAKRWQAEADVAMAAALIVQTLKNTVWTVQGDQVVFESGYDRQRMADDRARLKKAADALAAAKAEIAAAKAAAA